jgi:hypothetical protein
MSKGLSVVALLLVVAISASPDEIENNQNNTRNFNAAQSIYTAGVPHTDAQGHLLMKYDPQKSFFPIAMWGAPLSTVYGVNYDWSILTAAGFNTVWPWCGFSAADSLAAAKKFGMQVVIMNPQTDDVLKTFKDNPNVLGNVWMDEPIGGVGSVDMDKRYNDFVTYREHARTVDPDLNVFINDAPWITPPALSWWIKFNTAGDVECHDNYPIINHTKSTESIGADPNGIPQTVALAVAANKEQKPVWLIVGAFDQPGPYGQAFPFRYPTPEQLRACVYAGIIHGATGIVYFVWDTYVSRDGGCVGMSPNPQVAYAPNPRQAGLPQPFPATPIEMAKAKALWDTTIEINKEIKQLTPAILSPTVADVKYTVNVTGKSPTEDPVRCLLKPDGNGGYLLLTVNLDDSVLKVDYKFPKALKSAEVLFENRQPETLKPGADTLELTYEPFDTHVIHVQLVP